MLDFSFIPDEKPMHPSGLNYAGGIECDEFEKAQELRVIEKHLDYYGDFRWKSHHVQQKQLLLTLAVTAAIPTLSAILTQALAAGCGLVAFGD